MDVGFGAALILAIITIIFVFACLFIGKWVRPNNPTPMKNITYECAEIPTGQAWFNFNPRFYLIALVFVIFDIEVAFIFPVASVFNDWVNAGNGFLAFLEIVLFVMILFAALLYVWLKGDLKWIKELRKWR